MFNETYFPDVCSDFIGDRLNKTLNENCVGK